MKAESTQPKKTYTPAKITRYGTVAELTKIGKSGAGADGVNAKKN